MSLATDSGKYLYEANQDTTGNLRIFSIDPSTGALGPSTTTTIASPWVIAVDKSGKFVFAGNSRDGSVSSYLLDPVTHTAAPTSNVVIYQDPPNYFQQIKGLTISPNQRYLMVTSISPHGPGMRLDVMQVDPVTGALTEAPGSPYSFFEGGAAAAVTPDNQYVLQPEGKLVGANAVGYLAVFHLNGDGSLTEVNGSPFAVTADENSDLPSITSVAVDHSGSVIAVGWNVTGSAGPTDPIVSLLTFSAGTAKFQVSQKLAAGTPGSGCCEARVDVAFDPSNQFLYAEDYDTSQIYGWAYSHDPSPNGDGFTPVNGSPFSVSAPRGLVITAH